MNFTKPPALTEKKNGQFAVGEAILILTHSLMVLSGTESVPLTEEIKHPLEITPSK